MNKDPMKQAERKQKNKQQMANARAAMKQTQTEKDKKLQRKTERERKRDYRARKKAEKAAAVPSTPDWQKENSPFINKSSRTEAVSRVQKSLPDSGSSWKTVSVLTVIVQKLSPAKKRVFLEGVLPTSSCRRRLIDEGRKKRNNSMQQELVERIQEFARI